MSAVRDTYLQDNMTRDTAILMSHRLRKDSPRARPRARAPRINSRTGDKRARVPKIVLRLSIAIPIGTITIVVAGAVEAADGEDCSAARHREVMGRTGSAQQSPSLPHAEDEHAMRAIFMVGYVGFLSPIVHPVPRLSRKIGLLGLALEGYRLGGCRTTGPYGSRRGGSKYAPSRTLIPEHVSHLSYTLY